MKRKYLKILRCPDCKSSFRLRRVYLKNNREILRGALACGCRNVPVLEGIPIVSKGPIETGITGFLEKYATNLTDNQIPYFLFQRRLPNWMVYLASKSRFFDKLTFGQFLRLMLFFGVYKLKWYRYLTKRVSPSLNSASRIPKRTDKIIDLGCGAGGLLQKLKRVPLRLGWILISPIFIWPKNTSPRDRIIYIRISIAPSPFARGSFDVAVSNDSLHYVRAKNLLAREISRILKAKSLVFLGHVQSPLVPPSPFSYPISQKVCLKMFGAFKVILFREGRTWLIPTTTEQSRRLPFLNFLFYRGGKVFKAPR